MWSRGPIFTTKQEQELVQDVQLEKPFYGLTEGFKIAIQLDERNKIEHNFSKDTKVANITWTALGKRNPEVTLQHPEATSLAREQGHNNVNVCK